MRLTSRSARVLGDVLRATRPVRLSEVASRAGVSERTVKTDLNRARGWLDAHGLALASAGTRGLFVDCSDSERSAILLELHATQDDADPRTRRAVVALDLLTARSPSSITGLAERLGVARNTVLHDLNALDQELASFRVSLERTRQGVLSRGARGDVLLALDQEFRSIVRHEDLAWFAAFVAEPGAGALEGLRAPFRQLFQHVPAPAATGALVGSIVDQLATRHASPSDMAIAGMVIRAALVGALPAPVPARNPGGDDLRRMLLVAEERYEELGGPELDHRDLDFIFQEAALLVAASEVREDQAHGIPVLNTVRELVMRVDAILGTALLEDDALVQGLVCHLSDRFAKLRNAIIEPNLIVQEVLAQYPEIFQAVTRACDGRLDLSEGDLSFLAVHFAAARERQLNRPRVRTVIVCATGRGVANLIGLLVQSRFPPIDIVRTASLFEVQQASLEDVDLVISTFPVETGRPTAVVRSVPTARDFDVIAERLERIGADVAGTWVPSGGQDSAPGAYEELVSLGLAMNREIREAVGRDLSADVAEGLLTHCLLLAQRVKTGRQYRRLDVQPRDALVEQVRGALAARDMFLEEAELRAIAAYLELEDTR